MSHNCSTDVPQMFHKCSTEVPQMRHRCPTIFPQMFHRVEGRPTWLKYDLVHESAVTFQMFHNCSKIVWHVFHKCSTIVPLCPTSFQPNGGANLVYCGRSHLWVGERSHQIVVVQMKCHHYEIHTQVRGVIWLELVGCWHYDSISSVTMWKKAKML